MRLDAWSWCLDAKVLITLLPGCSARNRSEKALLFFCKSLSVNLAVFHHLLGFALGEILVGPEVLACVLLDLRPAEGVEIHPLRAGGLGPVVAAHLHRRIGGPGRTGGLHLPPGKIGIEFVGHQRLLSLRTPRERLSSSSTHFRVSPSRATSPQTRRTLRPFRTA